MGLLYDKATSYAIKTDMSTSACRNTICTLDSTNKIGKNK